jgi:TATA-binding protein-associated factor Taf7
MFKVADICQVGKFSVQCRCILMHPASQMLVVENKIDIDEPVSNHKSFNIDEFIWPHGITPPLHHVRKRRFRKRVNRRVGVQFLAKVNDVFQPATDN